MKKLMFAAALVASAAAFAAPINAVSFENGGDYNPNAANSYFYFDGESNSSVVSNDATTASTIATKRTDYYKDANNANYLALDTEGGTLWRSLDTITSETVGEDTTYGLGAAQAVASTGTYLDTLVQFTVTEDEAPTLGEDDKLAIWLQADEGTTNLLVKAAVVSDQGDRTETTFTVTGTTVNPGTWYRLTVKAIADITDGELVPGFQIFLDGNLVTADKPTLTAEYLALLDTDSHYADLVACKYFASLKTTTTLQGVGFQGTGAVDEIVWTEDNPIPAAVVEFTLTYSGDSNVTQLGAVTYTIDGGEAQTPTEGKIPDGASVSIAAPTFASGYQLAALTVDGTPVASPTFPYTFTMTADKTVSITSAIMTFTLTVPTVEHATATVTVGGQAASGNTFNYGTVVDVVWAADSGYQITANGTQQFTMTSDQSVVAPTVEAVASYPSYCHDDAALKTQYDTWKTTYGADSESAYEKQFLLNTDPSTTVADDALQIDSITENATAGWDIVVSTTVTGAALSDGSKTTYNGYLLVKAADTLADLASATPVAYPVTAVTGGKVSITVTSGKFMKVELTTTAPAQN